jgi:DNA-directed RNA polymerase beta' subunit
VYHILKKISDTDCIAMGLDPKVIRPEWMILTVLPVSPPPVRPSIMADTSLRSEDDLTYKLADILKANVNLKKQEMEGAPVHIVSEFEQLLQVPESRCSLIINFSSTWPLLWTMRFLECRKPCKSLVARSNP